MGKLSDVEALRRDRPRAPDNFIGTVISVNKVQATVDLRVSGDVIALTDIPVIGAESIYNVAVGDRVACGLFSNQWVVLGVVGKTRRSTYVFPTIEEVYP